MANTAPPLDKWFLALYFVATNNWNSHFKNYMDASVKVLQCHGRTRKPFFGGSVEMDEAFFGGQATSKRCEGSENKTEVTITLWIDSDDHPIIRFSQIMAATCTNMIPKAATDS